MAKKEYTSPEVEIENFTIDVVMTASGGGAGDFDNPVEPDF